MKKILISLAVITLIVLLLHIALFVFINLKGRDIIVANLQKNFGEEVRLDKLSLGFPFAVEIKNLYCGDISFRRAKASLGLSNPFSHLLISSLFLENPEVKVTLDRKGIRIGPIFLKQWRENRKIAVSESGGAVIAPDKPNETTPGNEGFVLAKAETPAINKFPLTIKNLYIKEGRVKFSDEIRSKTLTFVITDINARLKNVSYPDLAKLYLDISGSLKIEEGIAQKNISLKGWVDYPNKNMDAVLTLEKIDYLAFRDYYPPNWKPESLGVKEAFLSLKSEFVSAHNDLAVKNVLALEGIKYVEVKEGEEENPRMKTLQTILSFLKGSGDRPSFNFVIKTKMDSPQFDFATIKESFKATIPFAPVMILEGVVGELKEQVGGKLKDGKELTTDEAMDLLKQTGEGIVDTLKGIFVPKKNQQPPNGTEVQQ